MTSARYLIGDTLTVTRTLPDASVDLIVTSPPFLALRSYLPDDHPNKALEVGAEPDPAAFVDTLLALTAEWRRVLAPHGSIFVELGDTYSGSGGAGGDYTDDGLRAGQPRFRQQRVTPDLRRAGSAGWPEPKSLALIPELYRIALAYGRNPLTGAPSPAGRWKVRNVVRWHRPNPPVGALGDKFRPATSDAVIACTSRTRYFDLDAVREPAKRPGDKRHERAANPDTRSRVDDGAARHPTDAVSAPPLDTWVIPTAPYAGSHYAVFPPALVTRPIAAMTPHRVCTTCGEPSRRIVTDEVTAAADEWTDCGHDTWRTGTVLDPFAGSGTTLAVATGAGRTAIGIDLDERNADLALERVGPLLLTIEHPTTEPVGAP